MTHRLHNCEIRLTNGVCIVIKYLTTREFRKHAVRRQVGEWRLVSDDGFLVATWWVGWQSDGLHEADDDGTSLQRLNTAASPLWASSIHLLLSADEIAVLLSQALIVLPSSIPQLKQTYVNSTENHESESYSVSSSWAETTDSTVKHGNFDHKKRKLEAVRQNFIIVEKFISEKRRVFSSQE